MHYVNPLLSKFSLPQQNVKTYCIQKTFFMRYRLHSVPKYCTKLTLSTLQYYSVMPGLGLSSHFITQHTLMTDEHFWGTRAKQLQTTFCCDLWSCHIEV